MGVRIITDSTSALDPAVAAAGGVVVVPVRVNIGDESLLDHEVDLETVVAGPGQGLLTSGASPGAFLEALAGADGGAVVVTVAASLSSTLAAAEVAAAEVPFEVRIVDSGTAAGAQALVALHAARVASAGATIDAVEAAVRRAVGEVRLFGALETLEFLVRGGRVTGAVGSLAGALGVRPVFELRAGKILRYRPAFSRQAALDRLYSSWRRSRVPGARLHVIALHALASSDAETLLERVCADAEPATALVAEFGAPMVVHTGPGMVGLSWWWETPA
jgi:DegV family protein with EDD domain